jgi:membrane-bound lytic murein transglycosylase A
MTVKRYFPIVLLAGVILLVAAALVVYLHLVKKPVEWNPQNSLRITSVPVVADHGDKESLIRAIDFSLQYLDRQDPDSAVQFGKEWITIGRIKESLLDFKAALQEYGLTETFFTYIGNNYRFYRSTAEEVLFTGYYEADLRGSLTRSETYRYPLYRKPDDLLRVDLTKFSFYEKVKGLPQVLKGRVAGDTDKTVVPYYDRQEIDDREQLAGKNLEIAWIDDPIDVFFLHIQGSGIVQLDNGETLRVGYAESNGHPYRAIGRLLLQQNVLTYENMSMQSIRRYLESHPEKINEVFNYNPSYVFFRVLEDGPIGFIEVPVTPFRTIATDRRLFPKGALCYIETEIPVFDDNNNIKEWKPFRRFVLNQDTGGAIRTPARVDLFTGYGEYSKLVAGHMKQKGMLYFLVPKVR